MSGHGVVFKKASLLKQSMAPIPYQSASGNPTRIAESSAETWEDTAPAIEEYEFEIEDHVDATATSDSEVWFDWFHRKPLIPTDPSQYDMKYMRSVTFGGAPSALTAANNPSASSSCPLPAPTKPSQHRVVPSSSAPPLKKRRIAIGGEGPSLKKLLFGEEADYDRRNTVSRTSSLGMRPWM